MRGTNAKERIIRAYAHLLRDREPEGLTVREVYESAGVSKMSYYYHFSSLDDVQQALFELFLSRLDASPFVGSDLTGSQGDAELLKRGVASLCKVFFDEQDLFLVLMRGPLRWRLCEELIAWFRRRASGYELFVPDGPRTRQLPHDARELYLEGVSWQIVGWLDYLVQEAFSLTSEEFASLVLQALSVDGRLSRPY